MSQVMAEISASKVWDVKEFALPRIPLVIGQWVGPESQTPLQVEDMPIKFPGTEVRVPGDLHESHGSLIDQIVSFDQKNFDSFDLQHIYLTITQSVVNVGQVQRIPGWHVDGYQKREPRIIQHQYAVTNTLPTLFHVSSVEIEQLPKKEFFKTLAAKCETDGKKWQAEPGQIHLLNSFCPHRPVETNCEEFRYFVRLSFSPIPFTRKNNTQNPLFDYHWDLQTKKKFYKEE